MLDKFQLSTAHVVVDFWKRDMGLDKNEPETHEDAVFCVGREAILTALAAYSRVAALLASKVAPGCFGLLTEWTISCDELRRALEG